MLPVAGRSMTVKSMPKPALEFSDDRSRIDVRIDLSLDAFELEGLIAVLAEARATMTPPVPSDIKNALEESSSVAVEPNPAVSAMQSASGTIRLGFRNSGLGWVFFEFGQQKAAALRDWLREQVPESIVSLLSDNSRKKH